MAYEIHYGHTGKAKYITGIRKKWKYFVAVTLLLAVAVLFIWSIGADWPETVSALEQMADALSGGSDLSDAFTAFCFQVLDGALG